MTRLTKLLTLAGTAALAATSAARAADVALFFDGLYVNTVVEAADVRATLSAQGHRVATFTGVTPTDFRDALTGQDVLVIPEQSQGDLATAIQVTGGTGATADIKNFVSNGGTLVVFGANLAGTRVDKKLIDGVLVSSAVGTGATAGSYSLDASAAAGTQFEGGPSSISSISFTNSTTLTLGSLPAGSRAVYNAGSGSVAVAAIPHGTGFIIFVGWDWNGAAPPGTLGGGWLEVLNAAVNQGGDPTKPDVALLKNGTYVDFRYGNNQAEASNLLASAQHMGHKVLPFDSILAPDLQAVLASRNVLIIPEQENGDLFTGLSGPALDTIEDFVNGGGTLFVFGTPGTPRRDLSLVNGLFGFSLTAGGTPSLFSLDVAAASGTPFEGGPSLIPDMPFVLPKTTVTVDGGSLPPPGARAIYDSSPPGDVAVAVIRVGCGSVAYMGWDWTSARPIGGALEDAGWLEVLNRALGLRGRALAANDFDGDCRGDVLWRNQANGNVFVWLAGEFPVPGADRSKVGNVPLPWRVVGTGDFSRDGKADVYWHNPTTGSAVVWLMDGLSKTVQPGGAAPTAWRAESVKDYTGDGLVDVLWRNTNTNNMVVWIMNQLGSKIDSLPFGNVTTAISVEE